MTGSDQHLSDGCRYASSKSGHIFEVDYQKAAVRRVRQLHSVSDGVRSTHGVDQKQPAAISNGKPHTFLQILLPIVIAYLWLSLFYVFILELSN